MKQNLLLFVFLLCLPLCNLKAQRGIPPIKNYTPKEYKGFPQNWTVAQDKRGVMYFGNGHGILEYNGTKWRRFFTEQKTTVLSMCANKEGNVFIGGEGEIGYLKADSLGEMKFYSLNNKLKESERNFTYVWATYAVKEGICFATSENIMLWNGKNMKVFYPQKKFFTSFCVRDKFYVCENKVGIFVLENGKLIPLPNSEEALTKSPRAILPYKESGLLIATRDNGCYVFDGQKSTPLATELTQYFIDKSLYKGIQLPNGNYAFATVIDGIVIMNPEGKKLEVINESKGLINNSVYSLYVDRENELWLGTESGISRVEVSSPITYFDKRKGLEGIVKSVNKIDDNLFVSTLQGFYKYNSATENFEIFNNITGQVYSSTTFKKSVVTLVGDNAYEVNGNKLDVITKSGYLFSALQSKKDSDMLFFGGLNYFMIQKKIKNKWQLTVVEDSIDAEVQSLAEDTDGSVWLGNTYATVHHAVCVNNKWTIEKYDTTNGVPEGIQEVSMIDNKLCISNDVGIFTFNKQTKRFEKDKLYTPVIEKLGDKYAFILNKDQQQNYWALTATGIGYIPANNKSGWFNTPFKRLSFSDYYAIVPTEQGTFIGGTDGLALYAENKIKNYNLKYNALITMVYNSADTFFKGSYYDVDHNESLTQSKELTPKFSYKNNGLIFEYSSAFFDDEHLTTYSYYLEGFDSTWSAETHETKKEYTNLPEGKYKFRVRATNVYGNVSNECIYSFSIETPWYRTLWAYALYIISFGFILWKFIKWREKALKKENEILETKVKERTEMLAEANEELNQQNEEISAQRDEIESQKHLVEQKSEQIEEVLKDITDSINYAQRIQKSLLASAELLNAHLNDYFIFFQPKDIVSGDFYWAAELSSGAFALVTADSTGHGVPGAIMSMLNISCLNEAVEGKKLTESNEILNYTRSKIIKHLSNDGSDTGGKDGMDCSIIVFDKNSSSLKYAAANNPVWIVREKTLLEFAPDKMPVGKHDRDDISFTQHSIELQKDDVVYTLTDGMPDQFGGPKGKKFMYKRLKEILINISHLPMQEQRTILQNTLQDWKKDIQQVDDVCLIGIRI